MTNPLYDLLAGRQKAAREIRAVVGNGTGTVEVAGLPQHIWIRPYNRDNPVAAFSPSGTYPNGAIVRVEVTFVGGRTFYRVLGSDHEAYGHGFTPAQVPIISAHAVQHQIASGGTDVVYVHTDQFLPLLMYPTSPPSMEVYINPGYWRYGGLLHQWPGGNSGDLSSYLPATDYAHYLLVYFDATTAELQFAASEPFAASLAIPSEYLYPVPAPPLSVVVGYVLLRHDTTQIETTECFPFRSILNIEFAEATAQTWLLAARTDSLWQSAGGYSWTQIGSGDSYLTSGIRHTAVVSPTNWLVFRGQASASPADPIVYGTDDAGASWSIMQNGFNHTQGTALWAATAIARDRDDRDKTAVIIHPTNESGQPLVFITIDGGATWTPVDMTGMPAFDEDTYYWPMSIAVQDWYLPHICVALGTGGLYRKYSTGSWAQEDIGTGAEAYAVHADHRDATSWWATTQLQAVVTRNSWTSYNAYLLYGGDVPSKDCHTIYQHRTNLLQFAIGGTFGPQVTFNGYTFQQVDSMKFGKVGGVLQSIRGQPNTVYFTRGSDGQLYASADACAYNAFALSQADIVALGGYYGDVTVSQTLTDVSWLEHWLWG